MEPAHELRNARKRARLSQADLAARTGTSQATISAYESARKQPSIETLDRLLAACGARLRVVGDQTPLLVPSTKQHAQAGRTLVEVLALAEALPTRHEPELRFPPPRRVDSRAMTLPERLVELHESLMRAAIPHAFGGAIALAYWTRDPRGTSDIDINVFLPADDCEPALRALPAGIDQPPATVGTIARDGQVRLWWDDTPVDIFFDNVPVHESAAANVRTVPFASTEIPVLGPVELAVFKAMFDRTRDWADIEAMIVARTLELDAVRSSLSTMLEPDDPRFAHLDEAARRAAAEHSTGGDPT